MIQYPPGGPRYTCLLLKTQNIVNYLIFFCLRENLAGMPNMQSKVTLLILCICIHFEFSTSLSCHNEDWSKSYYEVKEGYSRCHQYSGYINGIQGNKDNTIEARCCGRPEPYFSHGTVCKVANWAVR